MADATRAREAWFRSPPGRYVLTWEQTQFDAIVADVFGFHALQCGLPQLDCLRANRMPNRMAACDAASMSALDHSAPAETPQAPLRLVVGVASQPDGSGDAAGAVPAVAPWRSVQPIVMQQFEDLPFAAASLDLIVLPHVLEAATDPHQVLREVDRVLRPEGRVIITGFNPVSLWGARELAMRGIARSFLPPGAHMLGIPRLRDWLKLLSFELDRGRFGCYAPPCRTERWLDRSQWMEKAGDRWWPICGALYMLSAVKRVRGMRLIGPAWKVPAHKTAGAVVGRAPLQLGDNQS